jgi:hypothetical protein
MELQKFNDLSMPDMFSEKQSNDADNDKKENLVAEIFLRMIPFYGFMRTIQKANEDYQKANEGYQKFIENALPSVEKLRVSFAPLHDLADSFVAFFRQRFQTDLIDVIEKQLSDAQANYANCKQNITKAEEKRSKAETDKKLFEEQAAAANDILKAMPL